ncbi:MAG TPA: methyltransferase [Vicinamibacterales bacterium]|nr:methyltransferase [Vicinamibacterales bacterium]
MKALSVVAFALMVAGLFWLLAIRAIFGREPVAMAVQIAAVVLMVWARVTFGARSFHATANPTAGGLVTAGPYAYIRHPIYSAVLYFTWAAALDHFSWMSVVAGVLVTAGAATRMLLEESYLVKTYPEYRPYMRRTRRVVPYVV